jgi:molecular chaperone GrpE (heat shock protein)
MDNLGKRHPNPEHSDDEEEVSLEELYKKLVKYNNNLYKIDTLIQVEKEEIKKESYRKLKNSLLQAINYQEEAIKLAEEDGVESYSKDRLKPEYAERVIFQFSRIFRIF